MSEKFGLDWKRHEAIRMSEFIHILKFMNEPKDKPKTKFRKRLK